MQRSRCQVAEEVKMGAESITMRAPAQASLSHLQNRRRRPIKILSARSFETCTDKWILPRLGNLEVSVVSVAILRDFIGQLDDAGLGLKSRIEIAGAVKAIIANCTNEAGEPFTRASRIMSAWICNWHNTKARTRLLKRGWYRAAINCRH